MPKKYQRLIDELERRINTGMYKPGDFLPGERTLSEEFGFSRVTVRTSLDLLTKKKLVYPVVGRGYMVADGENTHPGTGFIGGVFAGAFLSELPDGFVSGYLSRESSRIFEQADRNLIFSSSEDDPEREKICVERLLKRNVDAFFIMPALTRNGQNSYPEDAGNMDYFRSLYRVLHIPLVLVDRPLCGCDLPAVLNDDATGGEMQANYFLKRGFRRVVSFGTIHSRVSSLRYQGYLNAMKKAGMKPELVLVPPYGGGSLNAYWDYIDSLIPQTRSDTAFLCNHYSVPVLEKHFAGTAAFRMEWSTYDFPASLRGFPAVRPHMFMRRPFRKIAETAAQKLLRLMAGDSTAETTEYLSPEVIGPELFEHGFSPSLLFHS